MYVQINAKRTGLHVAYLKKLTYSNILQLTSSLSSGQSWIVSHIWFSKIHVDVGRQNRAPTAVIGQAAARDGTICTIL